MSTWTQRIRFLGTWLAGATALAAGTRGDVVFHVDSVMDFLDESPADGKRGTFDQLYPTGHDKYGLADQVGWRNVHHVRAGVEASPWKKWQLGGNYHSWWLAEPRDGLYTAGGAQLARIATGAASRHVGQELDVQVSRALFPQLQVAAGYAHIFPGGFLKQATPGASYHAPYLMATYVFLADK